MSLESVVLPEFLSRWMERRIAQAQLPEDLLGLRELGLQLATKLSTGEMESAESETKRPKSGELI